ncbi:MAG: helix-turn-helix domain-containing protein [Cyanobacteriota bacterium]|nr:helix-turn-helix domain-containing protein [Cyanobacteriota bacterium]
MSGSDLNLKPTQSSAIKDVGTAIRQGRESALISREELAQRLHMGCEQLEALEQGELHRLPEPVFIKAMVRRLASHLGLDADALVEQLRPLPNRPSITQTPVQAVKPTADQASGPPWITILLTLMAVVGLGSWARHVLTDITTSTSGSGRETTIQVAPETKVQPSRQDVPEPAAEPTSTAIVLDCSEPCWIALRRDGAVEFEGILDAPKTVENPEGVEVYPGRPDLVMLRREEEVINLGSINDLRWYPLNSER